MREKIIENTSTKPEELQLTQKHEEVLDDPSLLEGLLTPLERYIMRNIVLLNKPFSVGTIHNHLTLSLYSLWYKHITTKNAENTQKHHALSGTFFQRLTAQWSSKYYDLGKNTNPPIKLDGETVLAPHPEESTYNFRKKALASTAVNISPPSFNRIKRALELFISWGIITTRSSKGATKASTLYVMTIAFSKAYRKRLQTFYESGKCQNFKDLVIDILNEEAT